MTTLATTQMQSCIAPCSSLGQQCHKEERFATWTTTSLLQNLYPGLCKDSRLGDAYIFCIFYRWTSNSFIFFKIETKVIPGKMFSNCKFDSKLESNLTLLS